MSQRNTSDDLPGLFDLPLDLETTEDSRVAVTPTPIDEEAIEEVISAEPLPLFQRPSEKEAPSEEEPSPHQLPAGGFSPAPAPLTPRLLAGLIDLGILLSVAVSVWIGLNLLGIEIDSSDWLPAAIFLLSFSFLYNVFPLAFWGRTPGMGLAALVARTPDNRPLTFGQTALRWLGTLGTAVGLGLPMLLCLSGGSFTDRVSGSQTLMRPLAR